MRSYRRKENRIVSGVFKTDIYTGFLLLLCIDNKTKLTIVNLQISGAGGSLAASSGHPAGILARILWLAAGHAQAEGVALAGHLHAVRGTVVQRLVVSTQN